MAAGWDPVSKKPTLCPALIGLKIYGRRSLAVAFLIRPGLVELRPSGLRVAGPTDRQLEIETCVIEANLQSHFMSGGFGGSLLSSGNRRLQWPCWRLYMDPQFQRRPFFTALFERPRPILEAENPR